MRARNISLTENETIPLNEKIQHQDNVTAQENKINMKEECLEVHMMQNLMKEDSLPQNIATLCLLNSDICSQKTKISWLKALELLKATWKPRKNN